MRVQSQTRAWQKPLHAERGLKRVVRVRVVRLGVVGGVKDGGIGLAHSTVYNRLHSKTPINPQTASLHEEAIA